MKNPKQYRPEKPFVNETPLVPENYVEEVLDNPDDIVLANGTTGLIPMPPMTDGQTAGFSGLSAVPAQLMNAVTDITKEEIIAKEKQ